MRTPGLDSLNGVSFDSDSALRWLTTTVPPESLATSAAFQSWLAANVTAATAPTVLCSFLSAIFTTPEA